MQIHKSITKENRKIAFSQQFLSSDIPFMTAILGLDSWLSRDATPTRKTITQRNTIKVGREISTRLRENERTVPLFSLNQTSFTVFKLIL